VPKGREGVPNQQYRPRRGNHHPSFSAYTDYTKPPHPHMHSIPNHTFPINLRLKESIGSTINSGTFVFQQKAPPPPAKTNHNICYIVTYFLM